MKKLALPTSIPARPSFRGCDVEESWLVPGYRRDLPHWRLDGATYFVTFRLADSIPEAVARHWREQREQWCRGHGLDPEWAERDPPRWEDAYGAIPLAERRAFERSQQRQFLGELDRCHGCCLLERGHPTVAAALEHFHGRRVWTGDYVAMPNHVHVLVQPFPGVRLEEWLYSVKRFSSREFGKDAVLRTAVTMRRGHLWQAESFDRIVRDAAELARTRRYIAGNPTRLRAGSFALKQAAWLDEWAPA